MSRIFVTSDLHFCHNRQFLYEPRGFKSVSDMNETIIDNWNLVVDPEDDVYVLGDLMLNDNQQGTECIKRLNGLLHIVLGNHDTDARVEIYSTLPNVVEISYAIKLKYNGYHLFLTHYPCITGSLKKDSLKHCLINLSGHTHSKEPFYYDLPFVYNVALDAHNNTPVNLDDVIIACEDKANECLAQL